jgi:hypothetical protein
MSRSGKPGAVKGYSRPTDTKPFAECGIDKLKRVFDSTKSSQLTRLVTLDIINGPLSPSSYHTYTIAVPDTVK